MYAYNQTYMYSELGLQKIAQIKVIVHTHTYIHTYTHTYIHVFRARTAEDSAKQSEARMQEAILKMKEMEHAMIQVHIYTRVYMYV
jgi:hypothetical protein